MINGKEEKMDRISNNIGQLNKSNNQMDKLAYSIKK